MCNPANRLCTRSAKSDEAVDGVRTLCSISRTSASMEQPCCADCRRSFVFSDSSRFLMVILAMRTPPVISLISMYSMIGATAKHFLLECWQGDYRFTISRIFSRIFTIARVSRWQYSSNCRRNSTIRLSSHSSCISSQVLAATSPLLTASSL